MKVCNLSDGLGQLAHAVAELNERWAETQAHWHDSSSSDFEQTHLRPLPAQMQMLMTAVQALAGTVDKAARELQDPESQA